MLFSTNTVAFAFVLLYIYYSCSISFFMLHLLNLYNMQVSRYLFLNIKPFRHELIKNMKVNQGSKNEFSPYISSTVSIYIPKGYSLHAYLSIVVMSHATYTTKVF